jgi:hypothetical protein
MKLVPTIALLVAVSALPLLASSNSAEFSLPSDVKIGDVQLAEGHCKVTWTAPVGSQTQLTIKMDNQKTVTIPAQVVEAKQGSPSVQTFVANGVRYVSEFDTKNARLIVQTPAQGTK